MKQTQCERIINYITEFGSITPLQAIVDLGCLRLPSRIYDLKKKGYKIKSKMIAVQNRWEETTYVAQYSWDDDGKECEGV